MNLKLEKIILKEEFSKEIERLVSDKKCSYIEALILTAQTKKLEVEYVSKMITLQLKEKIQYEAEELNLMKNKRNHLPL